MKEHAEKGSDPFSSYEEAHRRALEAGRHHYIDPDTGYLVFTELKHRQRGYCCGNACRHCPFDHEAVLARRS